MHLLVTGAGGRIGRRLVEKLAPTAHKLRALARTDKPYLRQADEVVIESLNPDSDFTALLDEIDTLIHLADGFNAYEHLPPDHQCSEAEARLLTLERLAAAAARKQIRLIYLSTIKTMCGAYADETLTETSKTDPQSLYGRLKLAGEEAIKKTAAEQGSTAMALRFPIVFGTDIGGNMERLAALADTPWPLPFKGLNSARSLISADSLIDAVLCVLASELEGQHMFLLQDGSLTLEEIMTLMRDRFARPARLFSLPGQVWSALEAAPAIGHGVQRFTRPLELDDSHFRKRFNWQPAVDLRTSLLQAGKIQ